MGVVVAELIKRIATRPVGGAINRRLMIAVVVKKGIVQRV
jgi:hypothetical protein